MIKFEIKLKNALAVIESYTGSEPLHHFLSNFYKRHKQMGGRDRKFCSEVVYAYYRLGNSLTNIDIIDKIYVALYLFNQAESQDIFKEKFESFYETYLNHFNEKIYLVKLKFPSFKIEEIFPVNKSISHLLDSNKVYESIFCQPNTFIRVLKSEMPNYIELLVDKDIPFKIFSETCIGFEPRIKLQEVFDSNYNFEVQDYSSQRTLEFMQPLPHDYWLDCCAASGGKSLLLHSKEPTVKILATDIRNSTIENLKKRFEKNQIENYSTLVLDISKKNEILGHQLFDGIIADVPCTGSGTWARNPENLTFFDAEKIKVFSDLQYSIIQNVIQYLKKGKTLIYITCSVYKEENEMVAEKIEKELNMTLKSIKYLEGFNYNSDTMFCAVFIKN